jgi:hypothetical protein
VVEAWNPGDVGVPWEVSAPRGTRPP